MQTLLKIAAVFAGYAVALLAAFLACAYRELQFQQNQVDTSGGMYAWGDLITFSIVFGPLAHLPTCLALYFLSRSQRFWRVLSIVSLPLALTGSAALLLNALPGTDPLQPPLLKDLAVLGILRIYPAPMLFAAFIICTFIAPTRSYRKLLLGAAALETPPALCSFYFIAWPFVWFFLQFLL